MTSALLWVVGILIVVVLLATVALTLAFLVNRTRNALCQAKRASSEAKRRLGATATHSGQPGVFDVFNDTECDEVLAEPVKPPKGYPDPALTGPGGLKVPMTVNRSSLYAGAARDRRDNLFLIGTAITFLATAELGWAVSLLLPKLGETHSTHWLGPMVWVAGGTFVGMLGVMLVWRAENIWKPLAVYYHKRAWEAGAPESVAPLVTSWKRAGR
ncbi:MAG: hypothetical protein M3Y42_18190 [Actinomycetota bacterium]|nr:hypothetical protein [Actinomycetota bacterium]MDQ2958873.1 hypothetical protein [Actinomycetota bacterium]